MTVEQFQKAIGQLTQQLLTLDGALQEVRASVVVLKALVAALTGTSLEEALALFAEAERKIVENDPHSSERDRLNQMIEVLLSHKEKLRQPSDS